MMQDIEPQQMANGNSLTADAFGTSDFDFILANPPYGVDWKGYAAPIKDEHAVLGPSGRFGAGLPRVSDGSLLFLQHMLSKMKPTGLAGSASCCPARRCSPARPGRGSRRSAAGSWRTTGSRASSRCPTRCSTTPASRPTCGS